MNEFELSDYGIFEEAIRTTQEMNQTIEQNKEIMDQCNNSLKDTEIFMGPICDSCQKTFQEIDAKINTLTQNYTTIEDYLKQTAENYNKGDERAAETIMSVGNSTMTTSTTSGGGLSSSGFSAKLSTMSTPTREEIEQLAASQGIDSDYVKVIVGTTQREGYFNDPYLSYGWASAMINTPVSVSTMQGWDPYHSGEANYYSWSNITNGYNSANDDVLKSVYLALTNRNTKIVECNGMYSSTPSGYNCIYSSPDYSGISIYEKV